MHPDDGRDLGGHHPALGGKQYDRRANPEPSVPGGAIRVIQLGVLDGAELVNTNGCIGPSC